jgi:hypothetical protein
VIHRIALLFAVCLWLGAVCFGMGWMWSYNQRPGTAGTPPERWPEKTSVPLDRNRFTLIILAHPKCPCTRATVEELSKLMTNCRDRLSAHVLFVTPQSAPQDWYQTDLWNSAAMIPGVSTFVDHDGSEASRFQAYTSGQVALYDNNGQLRFRGGITQARGHVGDNAGRSAIEAIINTGTTEIDHTVVFGCPLFNPESECRVPSHGNIINQK